MGKIMSMRVLLQTLISLMALLPLSSARGTEERELCSEVGAGGCYDLQKALQFKVIAIFAILVASLIGIVLPLVSTSLPMLHPDRRPSLVLKVFAGGIILATGFMHVLPESWENLNSSCLPEDPWRAYPWSALIAMFTAVLTMMMDSIANIYFREKGLKRIRNHVHDDDGVGGAVGAIHNIESPGENQGTELMVRDQTNPHHVTSKEEEDKECQLIRYRIVIQILIMGIVVHELVIGLAMGVSNNPCMIRSLLAAMCMDQLFEGMGLGGCILQAEYNAKIKAVMVILFAATTPVGIAIGIGLQSVYNHQSPAALIVAGILSAVSAGLLIYLSLVDLLACEFMGAKLQRSIKFQLICYFAAFLGMGIMSLLAKWA